VDLSLSIASKPKTVKFASEIATPISEPVDEPIPEEPTICQDADDELEPDSAPFGFLFAWSHLKDGDYPKAEGS
jgi:hypothetical protein